MSETLEEKLARLEDEADRVRRSIKSEPCAKVGCDMQYYGGSNAGCGRGCNCSVPVYVCTKCGDSDYGSNAEAAEIRRECAEAGQ